MKKRVFLIVALRRRRISSRRFALARRGRVPRPTVAGPWPVRVWPIRRDGTSRRSWSALAVAMPERNPIQTSKHPKHPQTSPQPHPCLTKVD